MVLKAADADCFVDTGANTRLQRKNVNTKILFIGFVSLFLSPVMPALTGQEFEDALLSMENGKAYPFQVSQEKWHVIQFMGFKRCTPVVHEKSGFIDSAPKGTVDSEIVVAAIVLPASFSDRETALVAIKKSKGEFRGSIEYLSTAMYLIDDDSGYKRDGNSKGERNDQAEVRSGLELILRKSSKDPVQVLLKAEKSGSEDLENLLLAIAKKKTLGVHIRYRALHTADSLGNIDDLLFEFANQYAKDTVLAKHSILILGRKGSTECMQKLEALGSVGKNRQYTFADAEIQGAVYDGNAVLDLEKRFNSMVNPQDRIDFVIKHFYGFPRAWGSFDGFEKGTSPCYESPKVVWSYRKLISFSKEYPRETATSIFSCRNFLELEESGKELNQNFRKHLLLCVTKETKELFNEMSRSGSQ